MNIREVTNPDGTVYLVEEYSNINEVDTTRAPEKGFGKVFDEAVSVNDYTNRLDMIFGEAADRYSVSKDLLLAVAKAESEFNVNATSKSGAMGLMQLMPDTAKYLGVEDPYDAKDNVFGGAKLLSQLLDKYDGNISYTLAAYNAGSGNVDKYGGIPPFEETQNYVEKILGYLRDGAVLPEGIESAGDIGNVIKKAAADSMDDDGDGQLSVREILSRVFSYDEYIDFMRIFLENVTSNLQDMMLGKTDEAGRAAASATNAVIDEKKAAEESDAYIAFRNMSGGRIGINLRKV